MGNKHNIKNTHISRGKFKKRKANRKTGQVRLLNDNRIISLHQLQQQVEAIANHTASCKSYNEISINEQKREGLASVFTIHCNGCSEDFTLATSAKVKGPSGHQYWENNLAAVWGQMSTGGGHAILQETMSVLGLPTMTKKSFMATERRIGEWWWNHLQESMKSAGEMEKTIAISQNRYHQGVPAIMVIVDGGWSKWSHKHSYNAKSHKWKTQRRERITSSNVETIAKRRATTPVNRLVHQLLYTSFQGNTATQWGVSQEEASYYSYLKWLHTIKKSPQATTTINCGLIISTIHPWLAATPDGWVEDPQATQSKA